MILDEPGSGLDAVAEAAVHDRLRELRAGYHEDPVPPPPRESGAVPTTAVAG
ncbi:hypothetical protein [Nonomuraea sp. NPDC003201]